MPVRLVVRIIMTCYRAKTKEDAENDEFGSSRTEFIDFIYSHFLQKYGLRKLAERHLVKFISAVASNAKGNVMCRLFGRFVGLFDDADHYHPRDHVFIPACWRDVP